MISLFILFFCYYFYGIVFCYNFICYYCMYVSSSYMFLCHVIIFYVINVYQKFSIIIFLTNFVMNCIHYRSCYLLLPIHPGRPGFIFFKQYTSQSAAYLRRSPLLTFVGEGSPLPTLTLDRLHSSPPPCWGWGRYTGYSTFTLPGPPPPRLPHPWGRRRAGCSGYLPADPFPPPQLTMRPHVGQRGSRRWSVRVEILKPSTTASRPSC
jgi:hypothetical protein